MYFKDLFQFTSADTWHNCSHIYRNTVQLRKIVAKMLGGVNRRVRFSTQTTHYAPSVFLALTEPY